jgi:hypothetical protein
MTKKGSVKQWTIKAIIRGSEKGINEKSEIKL